MLDEAIDVHIDEVNELLFKVQVEGVSTPAKIRLVCEGDDVSYMFRASSTDEDGVIQFIIPSMKNKIKEGIYTAKLEVLIENKYFSPTEVKLNFKQPVSVVAEVVSKTQQVKKIQEVKVSAQPVEVKQPKLRLSEKFRLNKK